MNLMVLEHEILKSKYGLMNKIEGGFFIYCPRCRIQFNKQVKMKNIKRKGGFHKKAKYQCPECGLIRMKKFKK